MGRRKKNRDRTRVFIVQDKSGSMGSCRTETISGFNEYVDTLKKDAKGEVLLSLIQFDTRVDDVFVNIPLEEVKVLNDRDFVPGGMTALRDGVGRAIRDAEGSAGSNDKVLFVIMTDGGENSSREYSHDEILSQIKNKRRNGWEFVFLGAGEEAWSAGQALGIPAQSSIYYSNRDKADTHHVFRSAAMSTSNYTDVASTSFAVNLDDKALLEAKAQSELASRS